MNETMITLQGNVGGDVTIREAGEVSVASFRVGSTPRRFSRRTNEWADAPTQWYTVSAWRSLATTCAASLHRGDAVVVQGRLNLRTWVNADGVEVTTSEVEAVVVGHDLTRGTSVFTRTPRQQAAADQAAGDARDEATGESGDESRGEEPPEEQSADREVAA